MDPEQREDLKKEYENLSDDELREMLALDKAEYEPGVYELVEEEAQRRGLDQEPEPGLREVSPHRLEVIHLAKTIPEADILRGVLETEGIECFYSEFPLSGLGGGGFMSREAVMAVPVMVREADSARARQILSQPGQI